MPATLQSPGQHVPLDDTMGSMLIGVVVSAILFGISVVQTLYYYSQYPKDVWYLKSLVAATIIFDLIHMLFITHTIYYYLITGYYDQTVLTRIVWSVIVEAIPTGVTGSLVQCFYTVRVWRLSRKSVLLTGTILFLIIADSICGTVWVVLALLRHTYTDLLHISPLTISINGISAAADVLISGKSLYNSPKDQRRDFEREYFNQLGASSLFRGYSSRSDTMITKLTFFFVNTGLLTSLCAVGALLSLAISSHTLIYASWYFCIGRLYANSLLASLNGRNTIRGQTEDIDHMLLSIPNVVFSPGSNSGSNVQRPDISIRIETSTQKDVEASDSKQDDDSLVNTLANPSKSSLS
ncbi:uncharacterized protein EV420DRAFT_1751657 [Desarmillaria tabescens]|uniref:DUF6534 domain-containing protein n=1 Tax=Armillaria tabescens TaxID=1929756 RepID=A0AA39MSV6_ARMTA|nr:uncharacterized protein EV420DRAFT_1751657 [Desarmillaria tabescens]KAK0445008.1 hypothetical protein EV420DRAFT_1751657 [Desarmillaria tabescens]